MFLICLYPCLLTFCLVPPLRPPRCRAALSAVSPSAWRDQYFTNTNIGHGQCSHLLDVGEPVVVGERGAVHLYPQVARGLVRQQLARVPEVGLEQV